jgi:hypothetical protein
MEISIVISVARQISGEYVFVKPEKAFFDRQKANLFVEEMKNNVSINGKTSPVLIDVGNEKIECYMELGIFDLKVE